MTEWLESWLKVPSSSVLPIDVTCLVMRFFEDQANIIISHPKSSNIKSGPEKFKGIKFCSSLLLPWRPLSKWRWMDCSYEGQIQYSVYLLSLCSAWWSLMYWILHVRANLLLTNSCSRLYSTDHYIRDILTDEQVCRQSGSPTMWVASSVVFDPGEILTPVLTAGCQNK